MTGSSSKIEASWDDPVGMMGIVEGHIIEDSNQQKTELLLSDNHK